MDVTIIAERQGRIGRIRLDRARALNALDLAMIQQIAQALDDFGADPAIHAVVIDSTSERAFCAGGDVRAIRSHGMNGETQPIRDFFVAEYALNQAIADYRKPYIALIDGVCLGGGMGISVHGAYRVATERAAFAMPETAIALFPDIGASYFLPRLPGRLGMYLALTGARMTGVDAVHAGLATHYVSHDRLADLVDALARDGVAALARFAEPLPAFSLAAQRALIDRAFGAANVAGILSVLQSETSDFATATMRALRAVSPSSLFWSYEIVTQGGARDLPACLAAELALVERVALHPEFHEGVRSVLIDKDRAPKWQPARIEDVDPASISALFA
jgi:enoyl-CoA hydratase